MSHTHLRTGCTCLCQVVAGGTVQYTVALRNVSAPSSASSTHWASSNAGIATVDAQSGVAKVLAAGTTHIHVDGAVRSYVQLTAVRLGSAKFLDEEVICVIYVRCLCALCMCDMYDSSTRRHVMSM